MPTAVLMVATVSEWLGIARMPRNLSHAGFEVSLLVPPGSVAELSGFVHRFDHVPVGATTADWVDAFAAAVQATAPRLVLPCDDTALRLLMLLALSPPPTMPPTLHVRLATLIADSLGDPRFFRASVNKTLIGPAAAALGVRVPASIVVESLDATEAFVAEHGFPLVIKSSHSTAGEGVALCGDRAELQREFARLLAMPFLDFDDVSVGKILLQAFVAGTIHFYTAVAWQGRLVSGVAVEKIEGERKGPTSVVRYFHSAPMHEATARVARGFGLTGIFSPEFVVEDGTGELFMLEVNRRFSHGTHRGEQINVDAAAALFAAMHGSKPPRDQLDPGEEHSCAHFPQEWIRDPESPHLRRFPVDIPWDEPVLARALASLAVQQFRRQRSVGR